jgi:hypothetical protein
MASQGLGAWMRYFDSNDVTEESTGRFGGFSRHAGRKPSIFRLLEGR